jgi:ABC-type uncharacterized transport system involved in gliding motility auxiliary subunit
MKMAWLAKRQTKYGAYLTVYVLVVVAILAAANYLADRYNKTVDATSSKVFSLSDQTVKVVSNLDQDVKIYYFDSPDRFRDSRFGPSPQDMLGRYDNLSHRVSVELVDPARNPKRALDMNVSSAATTIIEVGGRREEAKSVTEEQITNALIRALKTEKRTACFLEGHGEHDIESSEPSGFSSVKDSLEASNFAVQTVSLLAKEPSVPSDCTVLVVAGPRTDLIAVEIGAIQKFVEEGGRALIMVDPPTKGVVTTSLVNMLAGWGVKVNNDIVVDLSGVGQFFGTDELSPLVGRYENHPIVAEMRNVASLFPLSRSVEPGDMADKVTVEKLFSTTPKSYATTSFATGEIRIDPNKDQPGPLSLGVAGTYRTGQEGKEGRFVVTGSSRFVANSTLGFPGGNRDLFLNMMSWLSSDEDLISIRPKDPEDRRLTLSSDQMRRMLYVSVILMPLAIIVGGTVVWWRRR